METCTKNSSSKLLPFNKTLTLSFKTGQTSITRWVPFHSPANNSRCSLQIEATRPCSVSKRACYCKRKKRGRNYPLSCKMPEAREPAVIPAAINPEAIVNMQQRRSVLNQIEDEPLISAVLQQFYIIICSSCHQHNKRQGRSRSKT